MKNNVNHRNIALTIIILAGGKSARIGSNRDKVQMKLKGIRLIDWVIINLTSIKALSKSKILIVGAKQRQFPYYQVINDIYHQKGPLGGILTGLTFSDTDYNLIIGCDMPFVERKLIELMMKRINHFDIIIPRHSKGLIEPLCAIYHKKSRSVIAKNILQGNLAVRSIFSSLKVGYISEIDIRKIDPNLLSFFNINYQQDFCKAKQILSQQRKKYFERKANEW